MKRSKTILTVALIAAGFVGGFGYGRWYGPRNGAKPQSERKILYYVDPMHPGYKSDRPGVAPDCGMKLVPVYADGGSPVSDPRPEGNAALPVGTIQIAPEKQQLIGVQRAGGIHECRRNSACCWQSRDG